MNNDEKNPSTATCFRGSCHQKASSGKFAGDWMDRRKKGEECQRMKYSIWIVWQDSVRPTQLIGASEDGELWHHT